MDQCHYDHQISDAIINVNYDQVIMLITLYPNNAKKYLRDFASDITAYRDKVIYREKGPIIIDMCKFLFEHTKAKHFNKINNILLKWAVDTTNIEIVKYVISLHKKFNTPVSVVELLNDDSDEFFDLTDEILHYFVKRHKEYGMMKISEDYCYWDNFPINRLANIGVDPIESILI